MVPNALAGVHFVTPLVTAAALFREVKRLQHGAARMPQRGSRGITNGRRPFRDFLHGTLFPTDLDATGCHR
jgi:hypothetical protein